VDEPRWIGRFSRYEPRTLIDIERGSALEADSRRGHSGRSVTGIDMGLRMPREKKPISVRGPFRSVPGTEPDGRCASSNSHGLGFPTVDAHRR